MPVDGAGILRLEKLQYDFFRKIPELRELNYWECLAHMNMISMQRRLERYRIIYIWKILEKLAPNCGISLVEGSEVSRLGRRLNIIVPKESAKINKMKEQAFQVNGPKLFNCLPASIRNTTRTGLDEFKEKLDNHLQQVPDQPRIDGMSPGTDTNSLLHQTKRGPGGGQLLISGA
jgi:hypothetical protein